MSRQLHPVRTRSSRRAGHSAPARALRLCGLSVMLTATVAGKAACAGGQTASSLRTASAHASPPTAMSVSLPVARTRGTELCPPEERRARVLQQRAHTVPRLVLNSRFRFRTGRLPISSLSSPGRVRANMHEGSQVLRRIGQCWPSRSWARTACFCPRSGPRHIRTLRCRRVRQRFHVVALSCACSPRLTARFARVQSAGREVYLLALVP